MAESLVLYAREDHVATITLNRPEAMNAMSVALLLDLGTAVERYAEDDEAWVAVVCGAGRSFCTGGDLKEALARIGDDPKSFYAMPRQSQDALAALKRTPKPSIASVHGHCLAGGLLLANACDLIVAGESATFGIPETSVGLPTIGYLDMWKTIGPRQLMEKVLTAEPFGAAEAHACGLVNRVVPDADVMAESLKLARRIAGNSPKSVQGHVQAVRLSVKHGPEVLDDLRRSLWDDVVYGEDVQEGLAAFRERRKPVWRNR